MAISETKKSAKYRKHKLKKVSFFTALNRSTVPGGYLKAGSHCREFS